MSGSSIGELRVGVGESRRDSEKVKVARRSYGPKVDGYRNIEWD